LHLRVLNGEQYQVFDGRKWSTPQVVGHPTPTIIPIGKEIFQTGYSAPPNFSIWKK
jgi:hypothetical protein